MIFAELWFLEFLVLTVAAVWVTPSRFRRFVLLAACAFFHAHYAGPAGMAPIIVLAALVYFAFSASDKVRIAVIATSVAALVYFKYAGFLNDTLGSQITVVAAPLAISFFVFEFVHLLSDKSHGKVKVKKLDPIDFSLFTIFFPSLASGPIKRFQQFQPEISRLGRPPLALLEQSLVRILLGYYKKFVIADALAHEIPISDPSSIWHGSVFTLSLLLAFRIYLDFSGYSDIAIGFAGLLNIRLPENFSFPYLATSISQFWNRWHISLSTWIRDYIYIMMGGNRHGNFRRFGNLCVAMLLCGLWHGAAMHFGVWGLSQGAALITAQFWRQYSPVRIPAALGWAMTFFFVQLTWLIFFYDGKQVLALLQARPFF